MKALAAALYAVPALMAELAGSNAPRAWPRHSSSSSQLRTTGAWSTHRSSLWSAQERPSSTASSSNGLVRTAARRIRETVPVHLPAHHQVCLSHGIWLSGPGASQFSITECPDIMAAERQARRLLRRCTTEQLIYARIQAARQHGSAAQISWKQRMHALIAANPRAVIESCPQELFTAAGYPETITATATMIQSARAGT
jgi:hypothetical protein